MLRQHLLYSTELPPPSGERRRTDLGIRKSRARAHRAGSIPRRCGLSFHRSRIAACDQAAILLALARAEFVVIASRTPETKTPRGQASRGVRGIREVGLARPPSKTMSGRTRARNFALRHRGDERMRAATRGAVRTISVVEVDPFHDASWKNFTRADGARGANPTPVARATQAEDVDAARFSAPRRQQAARPVPPFPRRPPARSSRPERRRRSRWAAWPRNARRAATPRRPARRRRRR